MVAVISVYENGRHEVRGRRPPVLCEHFGSGSC
jgi:hypothetical protein